MGTSLWCRPAISFYALWLMRLLADKKGGLTIGRGYAILARKVKNVMTKSAKGQISSGGLQTGDSSGQSGGQGESKGVSKRLLAQDFNEFVQKKLAFLPLRGSEVKAIL